MILRNFFLLFVSLFLIVSIGQASDSKEFDDKIQMSSIKDCLPHIFSFLAPPEAFLTRRTCREFKSAFDTAVTQEIINWLTASIKKRCEQKKSIAGPLNFLNELAFGSELAQIALGRFLLDPDMDFKQEIITKLPPLKQKTKFNKIDFESISFEEFCENYFFPEKGLSNIKITDVVNFFSKHKNNLLTQLVLSTLLLLPQEEIGSNDHHSFVPSLYNVFKGTINPLNLFKQASTSFDRLSIPEKRATYGLANMLWEQKKIDEKLFLKIEALHQQITKCDIETLEQALSLDRRMEEEEKVHFPGNQLEMTSERRRILIFLKNKQHQLTGNIDFHRMMSSLLYASALEKNSGMPDLCPIEKTKGSVEKEEEYLRALYHHATYALFQDKKTPEYGPYHWGGVMWVLRTYCNFQSKSQKNHLRPIVEMKPVLDFYLNAKVRDFIDEEDKLSDVLVQYMGHYFYWVEISKGYLELQEIEILEKSKVEEKRISQLTKVLEFAALPNVLSSLVHYTWSLDLPEEEKLERTLDYMEKSSKVLKLVKRYDYIIENFLSHLDQCHHNIIPNWSLRAHCILKLMGYSATKPNITSILDTWIKRYTNNYKIEESQSLKRAVLLLMKDSK